MGTVVELRPVSSAPVAEETTAKRVTMDDGYTRIAHGIVEELMQAKYKLSGREYAVLLVVIRKTYGYRKSEDWISLSQFVECTGINRSNCLKVLNGLVERKIIARKVQGNDQKLTINTNVSDWLQERPSKNAETAKRAARKVKKSNPTTNESNPTIFESNPTTNRHNPTPTKDKDINNNILKDCVPTEVETTPVDHGRVDQPVVENLIPEAAEMVSKQATHDQHKTESRKRTMKFEPADREFAEYMLQRIEKVNEMDLRKKTNLDQWANVIRLMREQDGRTREAIAELFHFANNHPVQYSSSGRPFTWSAVIRSPDNLRKKWDDLMAQYRLQQRVQVGAGNHVNNTNSSTTGQQHRSQQEYINDLRWMEDL